MYVEDKILFDIDENTFIVEDEVFFKFLIFNILNKIHRFYFFNYKKVDFFAQSFKNIFNTKLELS